MNQSATRTALVTGASSGIGAAVARALAAQCDEVVLAGRDAGRLAATAQAVEAVGASTRTVTADLASATGVASLAREAAAGGTIDVLVNSAGIYRTGPFAQLADDDLEDLIGLNLLAPLRLTRAVLPYLPAGASVVFLSSISGHVGFANEAAYAASKGAIDALVRALAIELAPHDVSVNAVAPGFTATPMNVEFRADAAALAAVESTVPVGRLGDPEDIAAAVAYLASPQARYVRGVVLAVDGGYPAASIQLAGTGEDA